MKRFWIAVFVLVIVVFSLVGALVPLGWFYFVSVASAPVDEPGREVIFIVEPGTTAVGIGEALQREGLIQDKRWFRLALWLDEADASLQAGEFALRTDMPLPVIIQELREAKPISYEVTIPEGTDLFTLKPILATQVAAGWMTELEDYNAVVWSSEVPDRLGFDFPNSEGLLFPETYSFPRGTSVRQVLTRMANSYQLTFEQLEARYGLPEGLSREEVAVVASLVEKEAKLAEERPRIAGVYINRIRHGMMLQADPTVIYSMKLLDVWDGDIKFVDLEREHPYNTYAVSGLPPGPIGLPGLSALEAAFQPEEHKFLFFVSRNDGSHVFSETYREHNRWVNKYQR